MSTTGGTVIDRVLMRLEESTTAPVFWSRTELFSILNEAYLEFNLISGRLTSDRTIVLTANTPFQDVPAGAIAPLHISVASVHLMKKSLERMDMEKSIWMLDRSDTQRSWAPIGCNLFAVNPGPSSSGLSVIATTLDHPTTLDESVTIDLEAEYIKALEDYTFSVARLKEGGQEFLAAMPAFDDYRVKANEAAGRATFREFSLWSGEPIARTGPGYSEQEEL